jgi:hypothetical protein
MTKGEKLDKDMKAFLSFGGEIRKIGHGHGQRGSNIEECKGIKYSWTKKAHK